MRWEAGMIRAQVGRDDASLLPKVATESNSNTHERTTEQTVCNEVLPPGAFQAQAGSWASPGTRRSRVICY